MVNVPASIAEGAGASPAFFFKIYSVIAITTLIALFGGYFFSQGGILLGVVLLLVFLAFFALQVILLGSANHYLTTATVLNGLAWAGFFYGALSFYFLLALGFLILFFYLAARQGKGELENSLKIKISRVVRAVVGLSLTAVIIFVFVSMILAGKVTLTEEGTRSLVDLAITPVAKHYVKDFTPDMGTGIFFTKLAERNPVADRQFVSQSVAQLKKDIEGYVGTEIDLKKSVSENHYQAFQFRVNTLTPQAKLYWALITIGVILLSVKSIEFLVALPLILVVFFLYQVALVFNFAVIDLKDKSQEVVLLK